MACHCDDDEIEEESEDEDDYEEEEDNDDVRAGSNKRRRRSEFIDDVAEEDHEEEDEDEDEEDSYSCFHSKRRHSGSEFLDLEAAVDSGEEDGEDDFINDTGAEIADDEDGGRRMHRPPMLSREDEQEDVEDLERIIQARYERSRQMDYDEATDVEKQALLPSVKDPKLWMVKCLACKGLHNIFSNKVMVVPIKEMTDVLSVESKSIDLAVDSWVRMKIGTYKGDLAKGCREKEGICSPSKVYQYR